MNQRTVSIASSSNTNLTTPSGSSAPIASMPSVNLLANASNINPATSTNASTNPTSPTYHKNKILAQMQAQSEIAAVTKNVAGEFKRMNIQSWYNWAYDKYIGAGIAESVFFNDAAALINEDRYHEVDKIAYEQEGKDAFLAKITDLYGIQSYERLMSLLDGTAVKNLKPVEAMQRLLADLPQQDEKLIEDTFISGLPDTVKIQARSDLITLRRTMRNMPNVDIMKEWAKNIQSIMPKGNKASTQGANIVAKVDDTLDNKILHEMYKQMMEMQQQIQNLTMNQAKKDEAAIFQAEEEARAKNRYKQDARTEAQPPDNRGRGAPYKNVQYENNRSENGNRQIPPPPNYGNRQNSYAQNNWRNPRNDGMQSGYQHYERRPNYQDTRQRNHEEGGYEYPRSRDIYANLCRAHQTNGSGNPAECEKGCRYHFSQICYIHNRHGHKAHSPKCEDWCRMHQPKN